MKIIICLMPLLLCFCSSSQPTVDGNTQVKKTRENNFQIKCATTSEGSCMEVAQARCGATGYSVVEKTVQLELKKEPIEFTYLTVACR